MTGVDLDEVFDRWSEGRDDAVDIEAVILLDTSGSMDSQATHAYESMWALKRALDRVNANCTVITFASEASVLYSAEERASNTVKNAGTGGGTSPLQAIKYSTKVLADSSRAVKVMFTITDGEWSNSDECDKLIQRLRDGGVMTALAYISGAWDGDGASNKHHGCEVFSHIRSSADLFVLGRQLVKVATQRNLAH
jgi:Mg-chelatase subunit ChlD